MEKQLLFIHGGGDDGYHSDRDFADFFANEIGGGYQVIYPQMPSDENLGDFGWLKKIESDLAKLDQQIVLVGHSLGASMLLKFLSERGVDRKINGVFLLAAPFWQGNEDWKQGLKLHPDFGTKLPKDVPTYFYHCKDDEEVSFSDLAKYRQHVPYAIFREVDKGGHQFSGNLAMVADDIKNVGRLV